MKLKTLKKRLKELRRLFRDLLGKYDAAVAARVALAAEVQCWRESAEELAKENVELRDQIQASRRKEVESWSLVIALRRTIGKLETAIRSADPEFAAWKRFAQAHYNPLNQEDARPKRFQANLSEWYGVLKTQIAALVREVNPRETLEDALPSQTTWEAQPPLRAPVGAA